MKDLRNELLLHLDSAYNLARWLLRNEHDAKDVVQEAFLRALKYTDGFVGKDPKPWFLQIIRNTSFTWLKRLKSPQTFISYDDETHGETDKTENAETQLLRLGDIEQIRNALELLPVEYREVVVLREIEGLSYEEISVVIDVPLGTIMSRLSRGRSKLNQLVRTAPDDRRIKNEGQ